MELDGEIIIFAHRAAKLAAVIRHRKQVFFVGRLRIIRMDKIEFVIIFKAFKYGVRLSCFDRIPADVRNFERFVLKFKAHGSSGDDSQTGSITLFRTVQDDLRAQADAKNRYSGGKRFFDRCTESCPVQVLHGGRRRAHAGENNPFGVFQITRIGGDKGLNPGLGAGPLHAADVAGAVINNCQHFKNLLRLLFQIIL